MSFCRGLRLVKMVMVVALAGGSVARTASAQVLKGGFTLRHEVRWGKGVLAAGAYSITLDNLHGPALITTTDRRGRCLVSAAFVDSAIPDRATGLLITRVEGERVVRAFNWREGGRSFVYQPITKPERGLLANAKNLEMVPIAKAQK